jgi:hypothetical protein
MMNIIINIIIIIVKNTSEMLAYSSMDYVYTFPPSQGEYWTEDLDRGTSQNKD